MNHDIIENLNILAKYYKNTGDQWRNKAYQQAVFSIRGVKFEITNINQVKNIKGIGKSIREKIKEYLDTGYIRKVEEVKGKLKQKIPKDDKEEVIDLLKGIWDIGVVKARELYNNGIHNLNDLRARQDLLNANQRIGLKYYEELRKPILREYIDVFQLVIRVILTKEFGSNSFRMKVAGSYRRGAKQSGDIDLLVTSKKFNLKQMVNVLISWGVITETLSMRNEKFMGIAHCPNNQWHHFRMDIVFLPEDQWGAGLLYFTGSKGFNVTMRYNAKKLGFTLNQHGLFKNDGTRIPVYTEEEIMNVLQMNYIEPKYR